MIDEIVWIGILYAMLIVMHYVTFGESDWIGYFFTMLLVTGVIMYLLHKFEDWGVRQLEKSDKKHWGES
jgi:hypothetical protein